MHKKWNGKFAGMNVLLAAMLAAACYAHADDARKVGGLKTPESVLVTKSGKVYVSEINGFGKDGDGSISEITKDGEIKAFATGLDDPKGLAIVGKNIYVTDKNRVVKVNPNGKWTVLAAADAFPAKPQFLNDIEPDSHGNLYVSDSGDIEKGSGGAIYRVSPSGKVTLIIDGSQDNRVLAPNGIAVINGGKTLLYVDFASGILYSLDVKSKELKKLAEGFGGGDGLVQTKSGKIYVSDWKGGQVFEVGKNGEATLIKSGYQAAADIDLNEDESALLIPDMKAGEVEWLPLQK